MVRKGDLTDSNAVLLTPTMDYRTNVMHTQKEPHHSNCRENTKVGKRRRQKKVRKLEAKPEACVRNVQNFTTGELEVKPEACVRHAQDFTTRKLEVKLEACVSNAQDFTTIRGHLSNTCGTHIPTTESEGLSVRS